MRLSPHTARAPANAPFAGRGLVTTHLRIGRHSLRRRGSGAQRAGQDELQGSYRALFPFLLCLHDTCLKTTHVPVDLLPVDLCHSTGSRRLAPVDSLDRNTAQKSPPLLVLGYDPFHLVELGLHVFDHLELGSTPVQVVAFPVRLEVDIALQIVCQKPHTAF